MALYYELQVFKDVYTLVQKVFFILRSFEYKYTLGQDMKRDAIQLVRSIYRANKAKDLVKKESVGQVRVLKLAMRDIIEFDKNIHITEYELNKKQTG